MKKTLLLFAFPALLFLSGCQMSEETSSDEEITAYIEAQAELIKASTEVDQELTEQLEAALSAEETFVSTVLINDVRHAQIVQEGLLASVESHELKKPLTDLQRVYKRLIESRIYSYEGYVQVLGKDDMVLFESSVSKHKVKDPKLVSKSLIEVNQLLTGSKLEARESLLPTQE